jgi:hypothetical protein
MYLKLEIDGEESFFSFPDKKRVTIGRAPTCDIQVMAEGISRIHMEVHEKLEGEFYAIDKGSTHGTFINDEPLQKDKPISFNTFFPARLGSQVFIYLLDEPVSETEASNEIEDDQATKVISSLDNFFQEETAPVNTPKKKPLMHVPSSAGKINNAKKDELIPSPKSATSKRKVTSNKNVKAPRKKSNNTNRIVSVLSIIAFLGFVAYKQWEKIEARKLESLAIEQARLEKLAQEKAEKEKQERELQKVKLAEEKKAQEARVLRDMIGAQNCVVPQEVFFCDNLKRIVARTNLEGAVKQLDKIYLVVDLNSILDRTLNLDYSDEEATILNEEAFKMVGRSFHPEAFKVRQNRRLPNLPLEQNNTNYYAFSDFIFSLPTTIPSELDEIKEIILIAIYQGEYKSHLRLDFSKIMKADLSQVRLKSKMLLRSNVNAGLFHVLKAYIIEEDL